MVENTLGLQYPRPPVALDKQAMHGAVTIRLRTQHGDKMPGTSHTVVGIVDHGGYTDSACQYILADGTHVVSDHATVIRSSDAVALIRKIAQVSTAVGFHAGEPAMELAGQIVSGLVSHPEHIDRFMAEGSGLFIDGTLNVENGTLTYRSIGGDILHPSDLRKAKGMEQ
jgi:hypothetical protein